MTIWDRSKTLSSGSGSGVKKQALSKDSFLGSGSRGHSLQAERIARLTEEVETLGEELSDARERIEELHGHVYTAQDAMWSYREACVMALSALQILNKDRAADPAIAHVWKVVFPSEPLPEPPEKPKPVASYGYNKPQSDGSSGNSRDQRDQQALKDKLKAKHQQKHGG